MKKILLALTGGTIGSRVFGDVVDVAENPTYLLTDAYEKEYGKDVEFDVFAPVNILSENLKPEIWGDLFNFVLSRDLSMYSGIIITHGSDTLSYTSAVAGMLLRHARIPVILIASGKPIGEAGSNGVINLRSAVCLIKENICGIFTCFSNIWDKNCVYLSTRILEADNFNDDFTPYGNIPYGEIINDKFVKFSGDINKISLAPCEKLCDNIEFKNKIMIVSPYPGLDYDSIVFPENCKAVLHILYHSSTAEEEGFKNFAAKCEKNGVDLYINAASRDTCYASTESMMKCNVNVLYNMSKEAAYAKLNIAYNLPGADISEFLNTNIYHEIIN